MTGTPSEMTPGANSEIEVAARLQNAGFYVDTNIANLGKSAFEIDIVATDHTADKVRRIPVEVKSGRWSHSDLFKFVGVSRYIDAPLALFVTESEDTQCEPEIAKRLAERGFHVGSFDDLEKAGILRGASSINTASPSDITGWRDALRVRHRYMELLTHKTNLPRPAQNTTKAYAKAINDGTFLATSPLSAVDIVYRAYKSTPRLALAVALAVEGKSFQQLVPAGTPSRVLKESFGGKHPLVEACMYIEHRARLSIIRSVIEDLLTSPSTATRVPNSQGGASSTLPATFVAGRNWLASQPTYYRYAVLWQHFMHTFGGFIVESHAQVEYEQLSRASGVPAAEVPLALQTLDRFFPSANSNWLRKTSGGGINSLLLAPHSMMAVGARYRLEGAYARTLEGGNGDFTSRDRRYLERLAEG